MFVVLSLVPFLHDVWRHLLHFGFSCWRHVSVIVMLLNVIWQPCAPQEAPQGSQECQRLPLGHQVETLSFARWQNTSCGLTVVASRTDAQPTGTTQRIVCSAVVLRGWVLCSADISKAVLQGLSYVGLAEQADSQHLLQNVFGFEDLDPTTEVCQNDKLSPSTSASTSISTSTSTSISMSTSASTSTNTSTSTKYYY